MYVHKCPLSNFQMKALIWKFESNFSSCNLPQYVQMEEIIDSSPTTHWRLDLAHLASYAAIILRCCRIVSSAWVLHTVLIVVRVMVHYRICYWWNDPSFGRHWPWHPYAIDSLTLSIEWTATGIYGRVDGASVTGHCRSPESSYSQMDDDPSPWDMGDVSDLTNF